MNKLSPLFLVLALACTKEQQTQIAETEKAAQPSTPSVRVEETPVTTAVPEALEAFKKGRDLVENVRPSEAVPHFQKAIELDPSFAQAHAYLGMVNHTSEGTAMLDKAVTLAAQLPESERLIIEIAAADRRGEPAKSDQLRARLMELQPTDWRVHTMSGLRAFANRDYAAATTALKKAAELNPQAGHVYNYLGYAAMFQGQHDEAVAALKKYAELRPEEPNPHDSLGDALIAAGKLEEAEAAYKKALEVAPTFHIGWTGVAEARALRGDWAGAEEALAKGKEAASRSEDQYQMVTWKAWLQLAAGKDKDALKTVEDLETEAGQAKNEQLAVMSMLHRAAMLVEIGKPKDALPVVADAWARADKAKLAGAVMRGVKHFGWFVQAAAHAALGNKAEVEQFASAFEEEIKQEPANARLTSQQHNLRGLVAMAGKDHRAAVEQLKGCVAEDVHCALHRIQALEQAGDKEGLEAAKKSLIDHPTREPSYVYVRAKAGTIAAAAAGR